MSREEQGDAPHEVPSSHADEPAAGAAPQAPDLPTGVRRRRLVTAARLAAVALLGTLAGWAGTRWWAATDEGAGVPGRAATAVVVEALAPPPAGGRTALELTVRLANRGTVPLTVSGAAGPAGAVRIVSVDAVGRTLAAGTTTTTTVRAVVDCTSAQPLRLPALRLRRPDRSPVEVRPVGDGRVLLGSCRSSSTGPAGLELVGAAPDGGRLRLHLRSPTGRRTTVVAAWAGAVRVTARPLPVTVGSEVRTVWLDPPAACPPEWVRGGLPRAIDLDVVAGAPGRVDVDTGFALPRWLRAGACAGSGS